jgi:hypothetical protein
MPLTTEELDRLQYIAHMCDLQPFEYFHNHVRLDAMSEGELWALAGMFVGHDMPHALRYIVDYAITVRAAGPNAPRPDPAEHLRDWKIINFVPVGDT